MRVYQFRHIRAERQSSRSACPLPVVVRQHHVTRFSYLSPTMTALLRGLVICLLCLLALATGAARAGEQAGLRRARRGRRRPLAAAARRNPLESRTAAPIADARLGAEPRRRHDRSTASRRADPLALQAGRERDGRRPAALAARPAHRAAWRCQGLSERSLPTAARPKHAADRRAHALGPRARERRSGDEDRNHRRGDRPDGIRSSRLLATPCRRDTRRARPPTRRPKSSSRARFRPPARRGRTRRSRSTPSSRRTAPTSPASPRATPTRSPRGPASPASRRARTSATTRR